jgi:hypothetical protein
MSACADSLTERSCPTDWTRVEDRFRLLRGPEWSGSAREQFLERFRRPGPRWIAPGRIEYMSTQRREDRFLQRLTRAAGDRTASPHRAGWPQLSADGSPHPQARSAFSSGTSPWASPSHGSRSSRTIRSSYPPISSPSGFTRLHPALPQAPSAMSCRTERYDGKRDLYFQHPA